MTKPKKTPAVAPRTPSARIANSDSTATAIDHYKREKVKRAKRDLPDDELMEAARREYKALLEAQAAKGKGGRPKKTAARTDADSAAEDLPDDE